MSELMNPEVVTKFEHDTWSRCAESYLDTFAGMTRETIPRLLEAAHISRGSHVLEIGSGPGHVAHSLTEAGAIVTGVTFPPRWLLSLAANFPVSRSRKPTRSNSPSKPPRLMRL